MRGRTSRVAGFTLTELVVVIGIMLILSAISIPALQAFRKGQRLDQSARMVQGLLSEARRRAVTKHARHVVVLYSFEDRTSEMQGTLESVRHAVRVYCEPVGDPSWQQGYFEGGYVGEALILPPGIRFDQTHMKSFQVFGLGPTARPSEPLDLSNAYFNKGALSRAIAFRPDGTFDYDPTLDEPAVNPASGGRNIYQPDEGVFQVPDTCRADIVIGDFTASGAEVLSKGHPRRALVDLQPNTGRATAVVFEIGDSFQPPPGSLAH
jgi:prepilin-type N-terminal cleavage/methylation domain-containing protein